MTEMTLEQRSKKKNTKLRSNKVKSKQRRRTNKHFRDRRVDEYLRERYCDDPGSGNPMVHDDTGTQMRVYFQNVRGVLKRNVGNVNLRDGNNDIAALQQLRELGVDVLGLAETNLNWKNKWIREKWKATVRRSWPGSQVIVLSIATNDGETVHQQGGVSLIINKKWAPHIRESGSDTLGRWAWATMGGSGNKKITVVSAYRPCTGYVTDGCETVWRQQYDAITKKALQSGDGVVRKLDPRERMLADLEKFIEMKKKAGHRVVLLIDANETRQVTGSAKKTYGSSMIQLEMDSSQDDDKVMVPSRTGGKRVIDHVDTYGIPKEYMRRAGQVPHGLGFESDHRGIYVDLEIEPLLGFQAEDYPAREQRRLKSKNKVTSSKYTESLLESLTAHNVWNRVKVLWRQVQDGKMSDEHRAEFNKIDKSTTESMLAAERHLPHQGQEGFTPKLKGILMEIKYYRLLLRQAKGIRLNIQSIQVAQVRSGTTRYSGDMREIQSWLKEAWERLRQHQRKQDDRRERFLDQLIADKHKDTPEEHKKAIEKIKNKHKSKRQFLRIKTALNRLKNSSLRRLEVPVHESDGKVMGWDVLCTKALVHERIVKRNHKHMDQASATPFGSGSGYDAIHGSARKEVMEDIHNGNLEWDDPVKEVNKWV